MMFLVLEQTKQPLLSSHLFALYHLKNIIIMVIYNIEIGMRDLREGFQGVHRTRTRPYRGLGSGCPDGLKSIP